MITLTMAAMLRSMCFGVFPKIFKVSWTLGIVIHSAYIFLNCVKASLGSFDRKEGDQEVKKTLSQVIFFPDKQIACRHFFSSQGCHNENCQFAHEETSLWKLIDIISEAETSLDVCIFTINCHDLANAVVALHRRGVVVRILTDDEQMGSSGSQIEKFRREGIQVRHDLSSFFMHHKFVVIDREVLVNGSFNWTRQAVTGNRENVVITNNKDIVLPFISEFEKLWEEYDPEKRETK